MSKSDSTPGHLQGLSPQQQALLDAVAQLLAPLAELCVGRGVAIQAVEELLRQAMVAAARGACGDANPSRLTSRISTMTGLTRREVTRIEQAGAPARSASRSIATEVFTCWAFEPAYRDSAGAPMILPRTGPDPSFEALAARITRDVHPRSLLTEMERLGMVALEGDSVRLLEQTWVPRGDWAQMVGLLGANVGDHLRAATSNVLGHGRRHLEQAVWADELSEQSLDAVRVIAARRWQTLMSELVPELERLMEADRSADRVRNKRLRIGMYGWTDDMPAQAAEAGRDDDDSH